MTLEHKMGENSGTDNMELEWHDTLKKTIDACSADTEGLRIRPGMNFTALSRTHQEDNWTHQEDNWTPEEPKLHYKEKDKLNNKPHNIDTNNENNNNNGANGGRNLAAAFANATHQQAAPGANSIDTPGVFHKLRRFCYNLQAAPRANSIDTLGVSPIAIGVSGTTFFLRNRPSKPYRLTRLLLYNFI